MDVALSIDALERAASEILNGRATTEVLEFSDPGPSSPRVLTQNAHPSPSSNPVPEPPNSTNTTIPPPCSLCSAPSKYTCPRCQTRTCSLQCSKTHKADTGCSGERNKVAYVPMKEYTWGSMMNDYTFLEEVGRRVGEVGQEIVKGGYSQVNGDSARGGGRGTSMRGRGAGRDRGKGGGKTKRDLLKMQLDVRDVDVEFLPVGMKRRKANQSSWDFKRQTALLTIEFKFHKPLDPLAPPGTLPDPPLVLLTHRNLSSSSLLSILQNLVKERVQNASKKSKLDPSSSDDANAANTKESLEWLQTLVLPSPEDPEGFIPPLCVLRAPLDPLVAASALQRPNPTLPLFSSGRPSPVIKKAYYKLDLDHPLLTALKHTQFVEFPTIEVYDPLSFKGALVDRDGRVSHVVGEDDDADAEREPKRRRLDRKEGKKRIGGLVGGYGSESESGGEDEEEEKEKRNVLSMLGEYSDSEDEGGDAEMAIAEKADADANTDPGDDGKVPLDGEDDEGSEAELEPAALAELLKKVKADSLGLAADEGEVLDWDDEDLSDADAEGEDDPGGDEDEVGYFR